MTEDAATEDRDDADGGLLGNLLPENFDWQELVRAHPIPAVLLAALGGFALGRAKGDWVMKVLSTFAAAQITRQVNQLLGDEVL